MQLKRVALEIKIRVKTEIANSNEQGCIQPQEMVIWTQELRSDPAWFYSNNQFCPLNLESIRFHSQGASFVLSSHFFSF